MLAYKFLTVAGATIIRREPWSTPLGAAGMATALVADAANLAHTEHYAGAPFAAALAAGHAATWRDDSRAGYDQAFAAERGTQSAWIALRLGLG